MDSERARETQVRRHKTIGEVRLAERQLHKLNALQASVDEQNTIIHTRVERRRAQDAARKAAKRGDGKAVEQESLLSKEGIEAIIRANFFAEFPDRRQAKHLDKFFRFVHVVLLEHLRKQAVDSEPLQICKTLLAAHVGHEKPFGYLQVRERLDHWGVVEWDEDYARPRSGAKGRARCYRVGASFQDAPSVFVAVPKRKNGAVANQHTRQGLEKLRQLRDHLDQPQFDPLVLDPSAPHHQWLRRNLGRLRIDQPAAFARVDELVAQAYPLRSKRVLRQGRSVLVDQRVVTAEIGRLYKESVLLLNQQQQDGQPEARLSLTNGRLNTAFTRLFTSGRDHTLVDGQPTKLVSVDLGCSQPYLLNHRLRQTPAGQRHLAELGRMQDMMRGGSYYEDVLAACKAACPGLDIPVGEAKTELFRNLQYSKTHRLTPYRRAFNQQFPGYHEALMKFVTLGTRTVEKKGKDGQKVERAETVYRHLAIELQRVESHLFLEVIAPRLLAELGEDAFLLTVHDSFYCLPQHAAAVARVMTEVLTAHTGYEPTIKVDGVVARTPLAEAPLLRTPLTKALAAAAETTAHPQALPAAPVPAPVVVRLHGSYRSLTRSRAHPLWPRPPAASTACPAHWPSPLPPKSPVSQPPPATSHHPNP